MHARFAAVAANLRAEKTLASRGKDKSSVAATAQDVATRDKNRRDARIQLRGKAITTAREEADFIAGLRDRWCRLDLGLCVDKEASLGDWNKGLDPVSPEAAAAYAELRQPVFQDVQELVSFLRECLASKPRELYFKWTMWVLPRRALTCCDCNDAPFAGTARSPRRIGARWLTKPSMLRRASGKSTAATLFGRAARRMWSPSSTSS